MLLLGHRTANHQTASSGRPAAALACVLY